MHRATARAGADAQANVLLDDAGSSMMERGVRPQPNADTTQVVEHNCRIICSAQELSRTLFLQRETTRKGPMMGV